MSEQQTIQLPDGQSAREHLKADAPVESTSSVIAAIAANIAVGVVKFVAAAFTGSSAMVSEGIHSIVDSGNGLLILFGMHRAKRKADLEHPFGYSQELYFWTMVVAVMIFALGGGLSIYEGISHLRHIDPAATMGNPTASYVVVIAAAIIEAFSLRVALKNFNKARAGTPPMQFIREAKDPSLFTVVLEDTAAELGLIFAFLGIFLGHLTHNPYFDGAASVLIGALLCSVAVILLRETKGLLIGEGLRKPEIMEVEAIVESSPAVVECGRILSLYMGPHDLLVTVDVTFAPDIANVDLVREIDQIEAAIVRRFPQTTRVFIESESFKYTHAHSVRAAQFGASDLDEDIDYLESE